MAPIMARRRDERCRRRVPSPRLRTRPGIPVTPGSTIPVVIGALGSGIATSFNGTLSAGAGGNASAGNQAGAGGTGGAQGTCFSGGAGNWAHPRGGGAAGYGGNGGTFKAGVDALPGDGGGGGAGYNDWSRNRGDNGGVRIIWGGGHSYPSAATNR